MARKSNSETRKSPMFSQRHYNFLAGAIASQYARNAGNADKQLALFQLSLELAKQFKSDNPNFKVPLWLKATVV